MAGVISVIPAILITLAACWVALVFLAWEHLIDLAKHQAGFWIALAFLGAIGGVAYCFRRWFRSLYGGAELVFSFFLIGYGLNEAVGSQPDSFKVFLSVAGGLYVTVRALDNIVEGWSGAGRIAAEMFRRPTRRENQG